MPVWIRRTDQEENFERTYEGHEFDRSIKIGLVMGWRSTPTAATRPRDDRRGWVLQCQPRLWIIRLYLPPLDVLMHRKIRVNPPWVGIRHYEYGMYI